MIVYSWKDCLEIKFDFFSEHLTILNILDGILYDYPGYFKNAEKSSDGSSISSFTCK